ncbi:sensor histidine kinase [Psychroserpens luteolus]|uniref:sensor histidine kinase n=1 Tax=Psychroserpens luteolus TaxID=2855840 RepID=UPI001E5DB9B4|nr:HAMP domain-containing sensor histidine kinase [Psychroserpens luteolus]MCD2257925.1 HAMP domain-containing histidine kinase [Psychroserpens luteolus]
MALTINRNMTRWIIIVTSFIIISLILWNTYVFFQNFKAEERSKMEIWSSAQRDLLKAVEDAELSNSDDVFADLDLAFEILDNNNTTPMILIDADSVVVNFRNIINKTEVDSIHNIEETKYVNENLKILISKYGKENTPIEIGTNSQTLYYGNSPLLNKLKFYPLALLLIIFLFAAVAYFFYKSSKTADQNKLWTGMAKETAHQIGTPLSSLVGWTEILRSENVNPDYLSEIEKDITRLQTITDRFSKIGSVPTLEKTDVVKETLDSYEYLKARSSKLIDFEITAPEQQLYVDLNKQLYSWTIENLVKNAIDAMKGKGALKLAITNDDKYVKITVQDTGKGISKQNFNSVFQPGYTTKKRGWGLGLSLAKRIIDDYHNGKIKVLNSEIGKGTTMQISLKLLS